MNKKICAYALIFLVFASIALAAPGGKKSNTQNPAPAQTVVVQNVTKIIVQNNSAAPAQEGIDWNLVGGIAAIIALAAGLLGWLLSRKQRGMTAKYLKEIGRAFNEYRDNTSKCESALYDIKEKIEKDFSGGKINDSAFSILDARLDKYLAEVRKDVLNTQFNLSGSTKRELSKMLEDGAISREEYAKFSKMSLKGLSSKEKEKLKLLMKRWESNKK